MSTLRLTVDALLWNEPEGARVIEEAAQILRDGGTVALPTETVYGLGANALDSVAVARIFVAKARPGWDPLIVHVCDEQMLATVVESVPEVARLLMRAFWPGPLTLLLRRSAAVPDAVTAGRPLVGVRMPAHPVALALIRAAGVPLAAPSANRFGHTSPTTAEHVIEDLDERIDAVLDGGPTAVGVESTVLDVTASPMIIYRPGAITLEQIREVAGPVELYAEREALVDLPKASLPSPGVGLRHYAPRARLILVEAGESDEFAPRLYGEAALYSRERVGVMLPSGLPGEHSRAKTLDRLAFAEIFDWGQWPLPSQEPEELAKRLFAGLRALDAAGCDVIVCPMPPGDGIAAAIRDRLRKAAYAD